MRRVSQFRGDRGAGSGVDEQFARQRTLRLSAVEATLPLHRRGRDKLGVEDAASGGGGGEERESGEARGIGEEMLGFRAPRSYTTK